MGFVGGFHLEKKDGKLFQLVYHHPRYQSLPQTQSLTSSGEAVSDDHLFQPLQIKTPYHPEHSLHLSYYFYNEEDIECLRCGGIPRYNLYHCTICHVIMHRVCIMKSILFVINQPKRHDHPLTLFPQQNFLICNICGLLRKLILTYICVECNFIAHEDCMYFPHIIKISRHPHRISYISYLQSREGYCGVCRKSIEGNYGVYACDKCSDYYAHSRCALRKDVWDGIELDGKQENVDITQDARPFNMISQGVIRYFLHDHNLQLKVNILDDENKLCQMCVSPIFEGNFYSCMECDFIIHETCANAPRRIQHALHPHPLSLKAGSRYRSTFFICDACHRDGGGFVYQCPSMECFFDLDVLCALISEPFDYKGHEHPLFLALDPEEKPICHACKTKCLKQLNCIKCDFILCFKCSTLPYKARYKHDEHFLKVLCVEEICETNWCEVCELSLKDTCTKMFYWCSECCTTFHLECLFGEKPYMKPGRIQLYGKEVQILRITNLSRPLCDLCKNPCHGKIFKTKYNIACSLKCAYLIPYSFL